ncbi:hypothetical protein D3C74_424250 [compost metagenome]
MQKHPPDLLGKLTRNLARKLFLRLDIFLTGTCQEVLFQLRIHVDDLGFHHVAIG